MLGLSLQECPITNQSILDHSTLSPKPTTPTTIPPTPLPPNASSKFPKPTVSSPSLPKGVNMIAASPPRLLHLHVPEDRTTPPHQQVDGPLPGFQGGLPSFAALHPPFTAVVVGARMKRRDALRRAKVRRESKLRRRIRLFIRMKEGEDTMAGWALDRTRLGRRTM